MDMEALFAEMRKAQTGGKDFVAEQRAREAAVASDGEEEASDERDEDDNEEDEEDGHLPARGLTLFGFGGVVLQAILKSRCKEFHCWGVSCVREPAPPGEEPELDTSALQAPRPPPPPKRETKV